MATLTLPAEEAYLERLMAFVSESANAAGFSPKKIREIELASEEALVNICHYAYPETSGTVTVACKIDRQNRLTLDITDSGIPFNCLDVPDPELDTDLDSRKTGGLGVYLIKKMTDGRHYRREKERNILTLVFTPPPPDEGKRGGKHAHKAMSSGQHGAADTPEGLLNRPLPSLDDPEGAAVPEHLPPVIDAHVHLFPDPLFSSIWQWFDRYGWPIRYRMKATEVLEFLLSRGIHHIIALHYAHKPGVARKLNLHMASVCDRYPSVTGMATVFPGEPEAKGILEEAFELGLGGVKLHCHVQCFEMESEGMHDVYRICADHDKPLVMHVGREPKSPAYACDPYALCDASRVERVLKAYPELNICVPHLGADEFSAYQRMLEKYDTLFLDTTMTLAEYLPFEGELPLMKMRSDRIMYGTDFPNIPYAWDRELKKLCTLGFSEQDLTKILEKNAAAFFHLERE